MYEVEELCGRGRSVIVDPNSTISLIRLLRGRVGIGQRTSVSLEVNAMNEASLARLMTLELTGQKEHYSNRVPLHFQSWPWVIASFQFTDTSTLR
ncbi:uncharacterized protein L3040_003547 [Drepanopeziza brunnea f. sp. 'multigermtubi']|uniref:uncharacterized protein n=1 Tax=Drepanopeziza brunnea f. sp. 'multigermtubi' TaxID=698441 RepID=UPI00238459E0|nr:hypothetical protein L3040_003547 [Drepanopeziza brunnea f. sp. 'multigermtubi']